MRCFKIIILTISFVNLLMYLSGSFCHASFDISTWSMKVRCIIASISLFIDFVIVGVILESEAKYENRC